MFLAQAPVELRGIVFLREAHTQLGKRKVHRRYRKRAASQQQKRRKEEKFACRWR